MGDTDHRKTERMKEVSYVCLRAMRAVNKRKEWSRVRVLVRGWRCSLHISKVARVASVDLIEKVRF